MQAARFSRVGGLEALEIVDLPDPHPGLGQVRTAVRAAGANASDLRSAQRATANAQSSFSSPKQSRDRPPRALTLTQTKPDGGHEKLPVGGH